MHNPMNDPIKPTWMKVQEQGRDIAPRYDSELTHVTINTEKWKHVARATFGEARPCGSHTKWTGDAYRYDIFQFDDGLHHQTAIRCENGAGCGWLLSDNKLRRDEFNLLLTIASWPDEARRWDAIHFIWEAATKSAHAAKNSEHNRVCTAYVEGRLKKRKRRGQSSYDVSILPKTEPAKTS